MSALSTAIEIYRWLHDLLANDATLASLVSGVYADAAPPDATPPYVVVSLVGTDEVMGVARPLAERVLVEVTVVDDEGIERISAAMDRIQELLREAGGAAGARQVAGVAPEGLSMRSEFAGDRLWRAATSQYAVILS